jgi:hypothetical protein
MSLTLAPTKRRKAAPKANRPSEAMVQRAIIDALRWRGVMAVHVPNGAHYASARTGQRMKGEGVLPGFPDLVCYGPQGRHALLEVKRPGYTDSDVSDNQRAAHRRLYELGHGLAIVTSVDEALAALRSWGWGV